MGNLIKKDSYLDAIDESIDEATRELLLSIQEDRERAIRVYKELLNLFTLGKNTPDDLRELNKAQELVQKTTDQLQKVLNTLAKIKTGDAKVQLAMINNNSSSKELSVESRQALIETLENILEEENETQ